MDHHAVIWSRSGPEPVKMGDLVITAQETRFSYAESFLASGDGNGLSLTAPPALYQRNPVVFKARTGLPFHPRLMAFIPGRGRANIQRRIYEKILASRPTPPAPGLDTDWEIILLAARDSIGHLDVFRDDITARDWYARKREQPISQADRHMFWQMIQGDIAQDMDLMDTAVITKILGPTPTVGGMIPKLLAAIPDSPRWDGEFAHTGIQTVAGAPYVDVLLKVEPREYEGVLALESLCLTLHEPLFKVPRHWSAAMDGMRLLAVQRFDQQAGRALPMESFFSVLASGRSDFSSNEDTDWAEVAGMLAKLGELAKLDVAATQKELYRRIILAFCTGNGDLHLENVALLGGAGGVTLAPVYDPAPMRAWPQHNTRSAVPIPIYENIGFFPSLIEMGRAFGYSKRESLRVVEEMLEATRGYAEQVSALNDVPADRRKRLVDLVTGERDALKAATA